MGQSPAESPAQTSVTSIRPHLDRHKFDPETKRVMGLAFEMVLAALRLADRDDRANEVIASRIIALAKIGESDPNLMCDAVLKEFRERRL